MPRERKNDIEYGEGASERERERLREQSTTIKHFQIRDTKTIGRQRCMEMRGGGRKAKITPEARTWTGKHGWVEGRRAIGRWTTKDDEGESAGEGRRQEKERWPSSNPKKTF